MKASESNRLSINTENLTVQQKLTLYPNPIEERATIVFDNPDNNNYTLYLRDLAGKTLIRRNNITDDHLTIDRGELKPGIYLVQLVGSSTMTTKMIVK